jgi:hypothetical protein
MKRDRPDSFRKLARDEVILPTSIFLLPLYLYAQQACF